MEIPESRAPALFSSFVGTRFRALVPAVLLPFRPKQQARPASPAGAHNQHGPEAEHMLTPAESTCDNPKPASDCTDNFGTAHWTAVHADGRPDGHGTSLTSIWVALSEGK